jgi:hypothetical protein
MNAARSAEGSMSLDRFHRWATIVVGAVVATITVALFSVAPRSTDSIAGWAGLGFWTVALSVTLLSCWAFAPCGVTVEATGITIRRRGASPVVVPVHQILSVEHIEKLPPRTLRLFGVGGFFGAYGLFWNPTWGRFDAQCTRLRPYVLIRRRDVRPLVLTPDDAVGFCADVRRLLPTTG